MNDSHDDFSVSTAVFSPYGSRFLTAAEELGLRVWDVNTAALLLEIPYFGILDASYAPGGERFVTARTDRTAQIWDADNGENLLSLEGHRNWARTAVFSPDGSQVVTTSDDTTARVWDAESGQEILTLPGHKHWLTSAIFDPTGDTILTTSRDGTAKIWEPDAPRSAPHLDNSAVPVNRALFNTDGQRLVTRGNNGEYNLWDTTAGDKPFELSELSDSIWAIAVSPVDAQFATLSNEGTQIWDGYSGAMVKKMDAFDADGNEEFYVDLKYGPNGAYIVAKGLDNTVVIFDGNSGELTNRLAGHGERLNDMAFDQDGSQLVTAGCEELDGNDICVSGKAKVWDVDSGDFLLELSVNDEVTGAAFNPGGNTIATSVGYSNTSLWDIETDEIIVDFFHDDFEAPIFSPDGNSLLVRDGFVAHIWDIENLFERFILEGHLDQITHAAYSPDGQNIITSSWDGTARVWDAETGLESLLVDEHGGQVWWADFSPDGDRIVTASEDGRAIIWPYSIERLLEMTGPLIQRSTPELTPAEIVRLGLFGD